jgi:hypothetical protein
MTYYIYIENEKINGAGQAQLQKENCQNIEITQDIYNSYINDPNKYIWNNTQITENPEYENISHEKEVQEAKAKILEELEILDKKRIRAICENEIKDSQTNQTWLDFYNNQVQELRAKLNSLS